MQSEHTFPLEIIAECNFNDDVSSECNQLPACTKKPLQMVKNAAAHLVLNQKKTAHVTPVSIPHSSSCH